MKFSSNVVGLVLITALLFSPLTTISVSAATADPNLTLYQKILSGEVTNPAVGDTLADALIAQGTFPAGIDPASAYASVSGSGTANPALGAFVGKLLKAGKIPTVSPNMLSGLLKSIMGGTNANPAIATMLGRVMGGSPTTAQSILSLAGPIPTNLTTSMNQLFGGGTIDPVVITNALKSGQIDATMATMFGSSLTASGVDLTATSRQLLSTQITDPTTQSAISGALNQVMSSSLINNLPSSQSTVSGILGGLSGTSGTGLQNMLSGGADGLLSSSGFDTILGGTDPLSSFGSLTGVSFDNLMSSSGATTADLNSIVDSGVGSLGSGIGGTGGVGGGGLYVPVVDVELNPKFDQYLEKFDTAFGTEVDGTTDSLRDLIAGYSTGADPETGKPNEDSLAGAACVTKDAELEAAAMELASTNQQNNSTSTPEEGPWMRAYITTNANGADGVPKRIPKDSSDGEYVQVNGSASIRCLLQEIVQYQKLNASTQIHQLLLKYIQDAQAKKLANQLSSKLAAANIEFAKSGYVTTVNGLSYNEPLYTPNIPQAKKDRASAETDSLAAKIVAENGDPIGALDVPEEFRDQAAQAVLDNTEETTSLYDQISKVTASTLDGPNSPLSGSGALENFFLNPNDVNGPGATDGFAFLMNNPQNTPLTGIDIAVTAADKLAEMSNKTFDEEYNANGGIMPTPDNPDIPENKFGTQEFRTNVSPGRVTADALANSAETERTQLENTNSVDEFPGTEELTSGFKIQSDAGITGFNTLPLQESKNDNDELIKEFYNVIEYGYFDINRDTTDWAQATMLMTYDQMVSTSKAPVTEVPSAATENTGDQPVYSPEPTTEIDWNTFF